MSKSTRHIIIAYIAGAVSAIAGLFLFAIVFNAFNTPDRDRQERLIGTALLGNALDFDSEPSEDCTSSVARMAYYNTCARQLSGKTNQACDVLAAPENINVPTSEQEAKDLLQRAEALNKQACKSPVRYRQDLIKADKND